MATERTTDTTGSIDRRTVVGVFDGPNRAEAALNGLKDAGFTPEQVSVVARDTRESRDLVETTEMGAAETAGVTTSGVQSGDSVDTTEAGTKTAGSATGGVLGGIAGGVLGWLAGFGALTIPGLGPIVAAGVLATTLGGMAAGAVAGGLVGALVGAGIPEDEARGYEVHIRDGRILLAVNAASAEQAVQAWNVFDRHGGANVRAYGADSLDDTGATIASSEEMRD